MQNENFYRNQELINNHIADGEICNNKEPVPEKELCHYCFDVYVDYDVKACAECLESLELLDRK